MYELKEIVIGVRTKTQNFSKFKNLKIENVSELEIHLGRCCIMTLVFTKRAIAS